MAGSILSWSREQRGRSALGVQAADDFTYLIGMAGGAIVRGNIYLETKMSVGLKAVERFRLVILSSITNAPSEPLDAKSLN